jgi:hypothetical protein
MKRVDCPTHGESVLRLAQGRLGYAEALRAEQTRQECPHCRAWWCEALESESAQPVLVGVLEGIRQVPLPSAKRPLRQRQYLAAAAVLALLAGAMILLPGGWQMQAGNEPVSASEVGSLTETGLILSEGFETEPRLRPVVESAVKGDFDLGPAAARGAAGDGDQSIFSEDLEEGSFGGWSRHS